MNRVDQVKIFRNRFFGRQDVFGKGWASVRDDGSQIRGYHPVCSNHWAEKCHLRLKDGIRCDSCEIKKYEEVSDVSVQKHINGDEAHIYYVLQQDGTVKFGALDFDMKPGKEKQGYTWEDVNKVLTICKEWGLNAHPARSTGLGFHIYFFMDDFYAANKFRAVMIELFERAGFMEEMRHGKRPLPEIFPKQSYAGSDGIGNGIKVPMIEPNFAKERNGYVDENNKFIPADKQWKYLADAKTNTNAQFDEVIAKYDIKVYEDSPTNISLGGPRARKGGKGGKGGWEPPLTGSIEKVLEGCAAFRKIKNKCSKSEAPSHQEGFSLYHAAMGTSDGLQWFDKNVPGWGKSDKDRKQLEHSVSKNYAPWTCRKMQECGVCVVGTKCFDKKPPIEVVDGISTVRDDLPKEQWPEPSPMRYAFGKGDDFLELLKKESLELKNEKEHDAKMLKLKDIAYRAQVFDKEQQKELREYLKIGKLAKAGEISKLFNEAHKESNKDLSDSIAAGENSVRIDGNVYGKLMPFGYTAVKPSRNSEESKVVQICSLDLWIEEERTYHDDTEESEVYFVGRAQAEGLDRAFEVEAYKWHDNNEFVKKFGAVFGTRFNILRQNIDYIRQASLGFSDKKGIERSVFLMTQGWYKDTYLTPSVLVDKDGVRPNTEQRVDLSHKEHAKLLDFKLLSDSEFQSTLIHIKSELLVAWPKPWTFMALPFTFLPVLAKHLGIEKKPTLFFEGTTGSGKTELTHALQHFYGDYPRLLNFAGTGKGLTDYSHEFKDALLVIDDFKGLDRSQLDAVKHTIHYAYDGGLAPKLNRDSTQKKVRPPRGFCIMSGEMFVTAEASMVARTILIEVDRHDTMSTDKQFARTKSMQKYYAGVTPRFIHWFLNQDREAILQDMVHVRKELQSLASEMLNSARVSTNLANNHVIWKLFVDFMVHNGAMDRAEREAYIKEHMDYTVQYFWAIMRRCAEEQNAVVFLRILEQLIETREVSIDGLEGHKVDYKPVVGFVTKNSYAGNIVYIYPDIAFNLVKQHSKEPVLVGNARSIARQLQQLSILVDVEKDRFKKQVRNGDKRVWVWPIDLAKLGFDKPKLQAVGPDFKPNEQLPLGATGTNGQPVDDAGIY